MTAKECFYEIMYGDDEEGPDDDEWISRTYEAQSRRPLTLSTSDMMLEDIRMESYG